MALIRVKRYRIVSFCIVASVGNLWENVDFLRVDLNFFPSNFTRYGNSHNSALLKCECKPLLSHYNPTIDCADIECVHPLRHGH
jgi:hypothetical protein